MKKLFSKKYFPPFLTIVFILISVLGIASLLSGTSIMVERDQVVLRSEPATNSQAIIVIEPGSEAFILNEQNGWYKVRLEGTTEGWVPQWFINSPTLQADQNLAAQILIDTPIYTTTDESSEVITTVEAGVYLYIHYEANGWLQVTYEGQYGFIPTRLVNLVAAADVLGDESDTDAELAYDREALEALRSEADPIAVVRSTELPLLNEANLSSDIIYYAFEEDQFKLLDTLEDDAGNEFYFVQDAEGIRGYLNSLSVAEESYSIGHADTPNASTIEEAVIMIDPGHGGDDPGAVSDDETTFEKNATLSTAEILREKLESVGATVIMTRDNDEFIELDARSEMSNIEGADVFISLHYDGFHDPTWSGTSTYFYHGADKLLSESINEQISALSLDNYGVIFGDYQVLRENTRPSILLELGYMSNANDLTYIRSTTYHEQVADAITQGLINYFDQFPAE